ncbi:putative kinesin-like protein KIN-12B [Sesbania bispinosa]|nr:putative kinesin-like protein KIN-12B [Sesbania bispinosa]
MEARAAALIGSGDEVGSACDGGRCDYGCTQFTVRRQSTKVQPRTTAEDGVATASHDGGRCCSDTPWQRSVLQ